MTFWCLLCALLFSALIWFACNTAADKYPSGGITFDVDGTITHLEQPTPGQQRMQAVLFFLPLFSSALLPLTGLGIAGFLFYRIKLKPPISVLQAGIQRIQSHDLDFSIAETSADELGQICSAFEMMRAELLKTNQELWRQAEERRRLNAAFAHDLRNPITVLKGTVKMLQQGIQDDQAIDRLESYTSRIEQYVEAMSGIQRLEQMPIQRKETACAALRADLEETARLLAPTLRVSVSAPETGSAWLDRGIFLTVAENLIGNAARFARLELKIELTVSHGALVLSVVDDGPGFPSELLQNGPKPFGKLDENAAHFGMGLYTSQLLCVKHGGTLRLENKPNQGAAVTAAFQ